MILIKEVKPQLKNGKLRKMGLYQCVKCGKEKESRLDAIQTTELCTSCNRKSHGLTDTRLYSIWCNMKARCYNPNHVKYEYYGAKNITIFEDWRDNFEEFYNWSLANGYSDELTIDRKEGDKGYTPSNCRWVDTNTQAANRITPIGKSGFIGVGTRYFAQLRYKGKILLNQEAVTPLEAALIRDLFIHKNDLPHPLNFPSLSATCLQKLLDWASLHPLPINASTGEIQQTLKELK